MLNKCDSSQVAQALERQARRARLLLGGSTVKSSRSRWAVNCRPVRLGAAAETRA